MYVFQLSVMNYSIGTCSIQWNVLISGLYLHRISVFLLPFFLRKKSKTKTYVKVYPLCRVVSKGHKCIMHKRMKYFLNSLMVLTSRRATLESFSFYRFKYFSRFWSVRYFAPVKTQFSTMGKIMFLQHIIICFIKIMHKIKTNADGKY